MLGRVRYEEDKTWLPGAGIIESNQTEVTRPEFQSYQASPPIQILREKRPLQSSLAVVNVGNIIAIAENIITAPYCASGQDSSSLSPDFVLENIPPRSGTTSRLKCTGSELCSYEADESFVSVLKLFSSLSIKNYLKNVNITK